MLSGFFAKNLASVAVIPVLAKHGTNGLAVVSLLARVFQEIKKHGNHDKKLLERR